MILKDFKEQAKDNYNDSNLIKLLNTAETIKGDNHMLIDELLIDLSKGNNIPIKYRNDFIEFAKSRSLGSVTDYFFMLQQIAEIFKK